MRPRVAQFHPQNTAGRRLDVYTDNPLHAAAAAGDAVALRRLLQVPPLLSLVVARDRLGWAPAHHAAMVGRRVSFLLRARETGLDASARSSLASELAAFLADMATEYSDASEAPLSYASIAATFTASSLSSQPPPFSLLTAVPPPPRRLLAAAASARRSRLCIQSFRRSGRPTAWACGSRCSTASGPTRHGISLQTLSPTRPLGRRRLLAAVSARCRPSPLRSPPRPQWPRRRPRRPRCLCWRSECGTRWIPKPPGAPKACITACYVDRRTATKHS